MTNIEQVREQIAKFICANYKGIDWDYDYPYQKAEALREVDRILSLLQPLIDQAYERGKAMKPNPDGVYENGKADGRREVIENIKAHGYLVYDLEMAEDRGVDLGDMIIPNLTWQALQKG